jgi:hypothetical protein
MHTKKQWTIGLYFDGPEEYDAYRAEADRHGIFATDYVRRLCKIARPMALKDPCLLFGLEPKPYASGYCGRGPADREVKV